MEEPREKSNFQTVTIPEDLILEHILPRLPVKSLTRFKSVSKSWLSTISTQKFAKTHLKLYTPPSLQFLLFSGNRGPDPHFTSVTFDQHGRVEETLKFKYTFNCTTNVHMLGCCNGLVCFRDKNFNFSICNPVIQQRSNIIKCPDFAPNQKIIASGFGYVSSIDDYKIACLTKTLIGNYSHINDLVDFNVCVFSLTTLKWERLSPRLINNVDGVAIARDDVPVLVNDVLYWCATNFEHVVGVNLVNAEISTIPLTYPEMLNSDQHYKRVELVGINGQLCLCYDSYDPNSWSFDKWSSCRVRKVCKLNKDDLNWVKMYDLNCDRMRVLGVSETEKWLVLNGNLLALLDPSKSFYRQYQGGTSFGGHAYNAWDYQMSLVLPVLA